MDEAALIQCVDAIAHGFEMVQSVYPGRVMTGPDAAAAFASMARSCSGRGTTSAAIAQAGRTG
jgi:2-oxo-3-hexenedioate decarboxylase